MSVVVDLEFAVGQVPYFDCAVPASGHDDWVGEVGGESDAGDPVAVAFLLDGELAFSEGVPQFDGLVARTGYDLSVVG